MYKMDRRSLVRQALLLVGATATPGAADALAAVVQPGKRQLPASQFKLLTALADTLIPKTDTPGAVDVGAPRLVDGLLGAWASPERRTQILAALDKIDALAREQKGKPFADLSAEERKEVLAPHDIAALKPLPKGEEPPATVTTGAARTTMDPQLGRARQTPPPSMMERMGPRYTDPGYGKLKELIVIGYYCSEAALTTELRYEHNPGAWEPSIPVTPETRPWGGSALI